MDKIKKKITCYGEWALITGASSGIGKVFALKLAEYKINLIITARRKNLLNEIKTDLEKIYSIKVITIVGDLGTEETIERLKNEIVINDVCLLINNAGLGFIGKYEDASYENIKDIVNVNCFSSLILTKEAIQVMKKKGKGAIIFLGSTFAFSPTPFTSLYSATKAFNHSFGKTLFAELKDYNIDVLSLNPGGTKTEFKRITNDSVFTRKPDDVVYTALKALGKKPYVVDGFVNRLIVFITKFAPTKITLNVAAYFAKNKRS